MKTLENKTIIITGANSGIGKAASIQLAQMGAQEFLSRQSRLDVLARRKFALTSERMAETYTWLAADPALETVTGGYWDAPHKPARANKNAYNRQTQQRLWNITARLAHL